jgi:hypothetical protein
MLAEGLNKQRPAEKDHASSDDHPNRKKRVGGDANPHDGVGNGQQGRLRLWHIDPR